jgi:hypothetical protein
MAVKGTYPVLSLDLFSSSAANQLTRLIVAYTQPSAAILRLGIEAPRKKQVHQERKALK